MGFAVHQLNDKGWMDGIMTSHVRIFRVGSPVAGPMSVIGGCFGNGLITLRDTRVPEMSACEDRYQLFLRDCCID